MQNYRQLFDLSGKTAVVLGAASGIGQEGAIFRKVIGWSLLLLLALSTLVYLQAGPLARMLP